MGMTQEIRIQGKKKIHCDDGQYWNSLSMEVIESPFWEMLKKPHLDTALSDLTQVVSVCGFGPDDL